MRHLLTVMSMILALASFGCGQSPTVPPGVSPGKAATPDVTVQQGERDKDGKLVLHVFDTRVRRVPVPLHSDFGFMLINVGTGTQPVAQFVFGSDRDSRVTVFTTLQEFTNRLAALPPASSLHHYDKCSAPTSWGLDTNILHTIDRFCASQRITVTNAPFVTCICPN
jgi:hypothetical protein